MIYINGEEFFTNLIEIYQEELQYNKSLSVDIFTSSVYLDISKGVDWSEMYDKSATRKFIDRILDDNIPHRIICSLPYKFICHPGCQNCIDEYNGKLDRLYDTKKLLNLNMKFTPNVLMNYYRVGQEQFIGSSTLTSSELMTTMSSISDTTNRMNKLFDFLWSNSSRDLGDYYIV